MTRVKRYSSHRFYLISPKESVDSTAFIEKMLSLKPVQEVFLTDGDYGYIVRAKFRKEGEPKDVVDYLAKRVDRRFGKVVSYYRYRK
ncbi:MAG: hypothetical protein M1160_02955 [Candidatus Marsarchaeota archaeon]|jgi:hypothetical protein|nr:hypothetical protein [Candidatus Marsarchaeota archaeon]MCL5111812.1 hypothetical protein [Candidatus Marsarchaeota archaeon]